MIGSFLTSGLIMALGYAYPAYECYKIVEKNKPEIEDLRFWCQYWILIALLTIFERFGGDNFISWLPMYSEAKLAFYIYLWYPKTKGTAYVYDTFLRPYVVKHEVEIDRNLLELRTRAGDVAVLYTQKAAVYGKTRFVEVLQYIASQSQSAQPAPKRSAKVPKIVPPVRQASTAAPTQIPTQPAQQQPVTPSTPASPAKTQTKEVIVQEPAASILSPPSRTQSAPTATSTIPSTASAEPGEVAEEMQVDPVAIEVSTLNSNSNPNTTQIPKETIMEDAIRITRGRLRRTRSVVNTPPAAVVPR
ncbi:HVA22-like protein i [Zostera marina]|uniref:HVA22-like protein n=1 Tax=Zostera marina TaxID=29655 RepID=A0A0K9NQ41_ZOSMR|nr:HVA22-like protein i [Zostera marina]